MTTSALNHAGRHLIEVFLYLQVLDILTTLIGFSLGNSEASPFVRLMVHWGPCLRVWFYLKTCGCEPRIRLSVAAAEEINSMD